MFIQVSLSFGVANYFQYATFISARAFLAGHLTKGDQKSAAVNVLSRMIGAGTTQRFGSVAQGEGGGGDGPAGSFVGASTRVRGPKDREVRTTAWEQGVTYAFKVKMYLMPMLPGLSSGDRSKVLLESQSWLGREPTEEECEAVLRDRKAKSGIKHTVIYDNGC